MSRKGPLKKSASDRKLDAALEELQLLRDLRDAVADYIYAVHSEGQRSQSAKEAFDHLDTLIYKVSFER